VKKHDLHRIQEELYFKHRKLSLQLLLLVSYLIQKIVLVVLIVKFLRD